MNNVVHSEKYCMFQWPYEIDYCGPIKKNYKSQITMSEITNMKRVGAVREPPLPFLQGVQGGGFLEKSPPGRRRQ